MSEALSRIRQASSQREKLLSSVGDFDRHIAAVRESFSALMAKARVYRSQNETTFEMCRAEHKKAELLQDRCHGLLSEINNMDRELARIKNASLPQEPPAAEKIAGRIEDYPGNV